MDIKILRMASVNGEDKNLNIWWSTNRELVSQNSAFSQALIIFLLQKSKMTSLNTSVANSSLCKLPCWVGPRRLIVKDLERNLSFVFFSGKDGKAWRDFPWLYEVKNNSTKGTEIQLKKWLSKTASRNNGNEAICCWRKRKRVFIMFVYHKNHDTVRTRGSAGIINSSKTLETDSQ